MKIEQFNSKMVLHGDNIEKLAEYLEITRQTLAAKLKGTYDFKKGEINKIIVRYELTPEETQEIFFSGEER